MTDYDLSACGGTHVERTGGIGVIAIGSAERFKGGSRIEFLCGERALQRFCVWRGCIVRSENTRPAPPIDMAAAIERMQEDAKAVQHKCCADSRTSWRFMKAQALLSPGARRPPLVEAIDGWDAQGLKAIAVAITAADPTAVVVLFIISPFMAPAQVVIARVGEQATADAGTMLKQLAATFGGEAGGKPDLAQGGGLMG